MLKEILIDWEMFNFKVWCVIGPHRYLPSYVKKRHRRVYRAKPTSDLAGLYFEARPAKGGILWLAELPKSPKEIGYLAHEMGHAVIDMHRKRAINLDRLNDETFCYAIAYGVTKVMEGYRK